MRDVTEAILWCGRAAVALLLHFLGRFLHLVRATRAAAWAHTTGYSWALSVGWIPVAPREVTDLV